MAIHRNNGRFLGLNCISKSNIVHSYDSGNGETYGLEHK